jgi:hypothetical protein
MAKRYKRRNVMDVVMLVFPLAVGLVGATLTGQAGVARELTSVIITVIASSLLLLLYVVRRLLRNDPGSLKRFWAAVSPRLPELEIQLLGGFLPIPTFTSRKKTESRPKDPRAQAMSTDRLLRRALWFVPKDLREGFAGDLTEDLDAMRRDGEPEWFVRLVAGVRVAGYFGRRVWSRIGKFVIGWLFGSLGK